MARLTWFKASEVLRVQRADAPRTRLEIVDQESGGKLNLLRQARLFDYPRQIRGLYSAIVHRSGDSEAGGLGPGARLLKKFGDDLS